jgi:hypothetical protein
MVVGGRNGCRGAPAPDARPAGHGLDQQSWADRLLGLRRPGSLHPGRRQPYRQPLHADPNASASADTRTDRGADSGAHAGAHADRHPHADTQAHPHADTQAPSVTNATADADPLSDADPHRRLDVDPCAWRDDPVNAWLDLDVGGCTDRHTRQPDRTDGPRNITAARCSRPRVWFKLRRANAGHRNGQWRVRRIGVRELRTGQPRECVPVTIRRSSRRAGWLAR